MLDQAVALDRQALVVMCDVQALLCHARNQRSFAAQHRTKTNCTAKLGSKLSRITQVVHALALKNVAHWSALRYSPVHHVMSFYDAQGC